MRAAQARQLMGQMRAAQPQHTAMLEELHRPLELMDEQEKWPRLLGKPNECSWRKRVFVAKTRNGVSGPQSFAVVEVHRQSTHSNVLLIPDHAAATRQLYWMLLMICKSRSHRLVMTSPRGEGAEGWLKLVQRLKAWDPSASSESAHAVAQC